jgi:asparagine synthase (glutamine-hydrolysing)
VSGIFGLVRRDGAPVGDALSTMRAAMPQWGPDGFGEWSDDDAGLGQARTFSMPESHAEALPAHDPIAGFAFTAAGRLDNRDALIAELDLPQRGRDLPDSGVMMAAYRRWGEGAPRRLLGDWSFAAWHPVQRRLFLARDLLGHAALFYHCDRHTVAFSASLPALLAVGLTPIELDELYLAQYLISWPRYHGERTASSAARRVPPAHTLTATPEGVQTRCYRRLEDESQLLLPSRSDYVVALRQTFDEAVRTRLRCVGPVGVTLSGGLDSSAVAVTAAAMVRERGERLTAFTSVPIGSSRDDRSMFGDELPFVRAIAAAAGNIDIEPVPASGVSPIDGIRWALQVYGEPIHAASNMFWLLDLHRQVKAAGSLVLLTGARGNGTISWAGDPFALPVGGQLSTLGYQRWLRLRVRRALPVRMWLELAKRRVDPDWYRASAIAPAFAQRLRLAERRLEDPETLDGARGDLRLLALKPGRSNQGSNTATLGASFGIDVRDPTADARVLALTLSVPEEIFRNPDDGSGRWLIREAMRDRVPDQVRLNRRRGLQAADLVARLRHRPGEVDDALDEVGEGPAADYLDIAHMRDCWGTIQREDTPDSHRMAVSILTRGIMAGLFANAVRRGKLPDLPAGAPAGLNRP